MGKDFTDGPRGEADRGTDSDGNTYHRPQDNRGMTDVRDGGPEKRRKDRKVADQGPPEQGTDSHAGVEKAASAAERMKDRGVAHERHPETREGF